MMRNLILLVLSLFLSTACKQQANVIVEDGFVDEASNSNQTSEELVSAVMDAFVGLEGSAPGISIAVSKDNKIIYAKGFGYADVEAMKKITAKTQFRAASVSKMMTATAVAKLIQDKRLDLDRPIQEYVPLFPEKAYEITPRAIAGHISGMPHYSSSDRIEARYYGSVNESLQTFSHQKLLFEPGTGYQYSTHGYTLLSAVVEGASGLPFLEYLSKEIFSPLHMSSTGPHMINDEKEAMTVLYSIDKTGNASKIQNPEDPSYKWGAGGMVSTPSDLVKMGNAYMNGFFKPETVNEMFKPQKLQSGKSTGVGIGWRSNQDPQGRRIYEHAGSMGGTRSVICIYPDQNLSIAIMANTQRPYRIEETAHLMASLFLTDRAPTQQPLGTAKVKFSVNNNGDIIETKGTLYLDGVDDRLEIETANGLSKTHNIIYMQRDGLYAGITTDGVFYVNITANGPKIEGKVLSYGSPQLLPPTYENPYMAFEGELENN